MNQSAPSIIPAKTQLTPGPNCLGLIRHFESFEAKPYLCPANVPTIGYGSTRYEDGRPVTLRDAPITQARAESLLLATLETYADAVRHYVNVPLKQNQFDALVSFTYNVGAENLRRSTLLVHLNRGRFSLAADQFALWVKAAGKVLPGLVKRRSAERRLFVQGSLT